VVARAAAKAAAREVVSEGANVVVGGSVGDLEPRRHRRIATRRTCRRGRRLPPRRAPDPTHIGGSRHDEGAAQQPAAVDLVDLAGTHLCGPALDSTPVRRPTAAVSCGRGSRCGEEADRSSAAAEHAHQHAALSRVLAKEFPRICMYPSNICGRKTAQPLARYTISSEMQNLRCNLGWRLPVAHINVSKRGKAL
jgi:hypothetical protein